jgi:hypothetical protein
MSEVNLEEVKRYALSDSDINDILEPDTTVQAYRVLDTLEHIDELFDKLGRAVLLYATENQNTGHWVGLIKRKTTVEFFDPYGFKPDTQQTELGEGIDNEEYEQHDHDLTRLLRESGYKVYYNQYQLQDFDDVTLATCGRHVATRLIHYKMSFTKYVEMIKKSGMRPDDFVAMYTYNIINK